MTISKKSRFAVLTLIFGINPYPTSNGNQPYPTLHTRERYGNMDEDYSSSDFDTEEVQYTDKPCVNYNHGHKKQNHNRNKPQIRSRSRRMQKNKPNMACFHCSNTECRVSRYPYPEDNNKIKQNMETCRKARGDNKNI